ncbi:transferase [Lithospermum erythrorhizon]|uniref:Quinolinate synthase, chloroplastic n=1 Tax=Lithospermum erythrorhizon TaxID=34254 RepID=A0AAV3QIS3_LITER
MEKSAATAMKASSSTFLNKAPIFENSNPRKSTTFNFCKPQLVKCINQEPFFSIRPFSKNPTKSTKNPSFCCSAITSFTSHQNQIMDPNHPDSTKAKLEHLIQEFQSLIEPLDRVKKLLHYANMLNPMQESLKITENRVPGCTARVWLYAEMGSDQKIRFFADSDSEITKGFCACLIWLLNGATFEEVMELRTEDLMPLSVVGLNNYQGISSSSRANSWHNVLVSMQKRAKSLVAQREGRQIGEKFPSLVISADGIQANGSYAQAQARFLSPDENKVKELASLLKEKKIGVVAHFYMDPEVQGVLTAAQKLWPHIYISDSLVMADTAVKMAKEGCDFITVLGVDFMSENVRAILDQAGFPEVGVYRMSDERIGCSLADAAASPAYLDYLSTASLSSPSIHVVYINTSLETKAYAHELVPTITCTSSNVVQTILQAFAEVPNLTVWYGPDTYMGANIAELFRQMIVMTDEEIAEIHPKHSRNSIKSLLPRLHYYQDGTCIVHHLFGHEVVETINEMYCDAFLTAHFEVPGEMFSLAMEAKRRGMGVVGSTQNILDFIKKRLQEALDRDVDEHLQFILGTESGMVTSIVAAVRQLFRSTKSSGGKVTVEIVFPVSSESVTRTPTSLSTSQSNGEAGKTLNMAVIPGVSSGEGCSIHGGCASCPYMKMNSLASLLKVCQSLPDNKTSLMAYEAGRFSLQTPNGKQIADVGCEPILHMRHFQATKRLPEKLINQILQPNNNGRAKT